MFYFFFQSQIQQTKITLPNGHGDGGHTMAGLIEAECAVNKRLNSG